MEKFEKLGTRTIETVSALAGPTFAAGIDERRRILILHTCSAQNKSRIDPDSYDVLLRNADVAKVVVRVHKRKILAAPRSLEHWLKAFDGQWVLFDPTSIFARASFLVQAARTIRQSAGLDVRGCYFDASLRVLYVVTREGLSSERMRALNDGAAAQFHSQDVSAGGFDPSAIAVRVVSRLPALTAVPIDARSPSMQRRRWRGVVRGAVASLLTSGLAVGAAAAHTGDLNGAIGQTATQELGVIGGLSVFADNGSGAAVDAFATTGLRFYFGDEGVATKIEVELAQGGPNDRSGLRIVVTPEPKTEDSPDLWRPKWATPYTAGAGPGS